MIHPINKVKALGLCSGGLDSILSGVVLKQQGIHVEWISFETPFFSAEKAQKASKMTNIPLIIKNITSEYLPMLKNPPCGYGTEMNPCLDCHALMFKIAGSVMNELGFNFLFSGEVLGQRPMSQTKNSLRYVEKKSGFEGYILRPLSAKRLPETIPESSKLINRDNLLDIAGRGRKIQIALAKEFGINEYPAPAGGCLLCDKGYSDRLRDFFQYNDSWNEKDFELLKHGRHFRIDAKTKLVIGREEKDNENILKYFDKENDIILQVDKIPGPIGLIFKATPDSDIELASSICASYSKADLNIPADILIESENINKIIRIKFTNKEEYKKFLI
ncbi:MAG: tRNA 4-thiouridine(8) synthase ThiI [Desulfobacterales bacterium]|nr:tRNA 4-thiouridine(8) synthase ThiI [Desulfobacterales bacterium]